VAEPAVPVVVTDSAREVLAGLPEHRRELFDLRLERWWPDLYDGLRGAYQPADADALAVRLVRAAADAYAERDPELLRLDLRRMLEPDWLQAPRMLGYAAYADRFADDLHGVGDRVGYLCELGVTYLHLLPLLRSREGDDDGGYAVVDYRCVRPELGTVEDLRELAGTLRRNGISLVLDLVLNHVAAEHGWAKAARAGDERFRRYFHLFDDRRLPDAYEQTLPEVFPDFAPGSFTWDDELAAWVWTTFNSWQWDVNWSNPDVLAEYADIILFLANLGVEVLRLDAIAFLWKRVGTTSQNQPEVHAITQALRAVARIACPAMAFKAEAIVAPRELVRYLGEGEHVGKVSDLAYHNSLMVQVWSMLATGDVRLVAHALREIPPTPPTTAWITYLRSHDDIGWAIDDADAAAAGLSGWAHRSFLSDWYCGTFGGSTSRGLVFQHNRETGDRRISGTAASLAGLEAALETQDAEGVDAAIGRILLAHAVVMGFGGIPVIWSGDELGLRNDPGWAAEDGHCEDNRWAHRPRLPWDVAAIRHDPATPTGRVFAGLAHLAAVRSGLPHLHACVPAQVLDEDDPGVLGVLRRHPTGPLLGLYNVTGSWRSWPVRALADVSLTEPVDALTGRRSTFQDARLWLPPHAAQWLR